IELARATTPDIETSATLSSRFGPLINEDGSTTFRLWAPSLTRAEVMFEDGTAALMHPDRDGFLVARVENIPEGKLYQFRAGGKHFPDLASRQQQADANGWSVVRRPLPPSANKEPLRPWHETIICEVHIGSVTPEGTFNGLRERREHIRDAGYTCL